MRSKGPKEKSKIQKPHACSVLITCDQPDEDGEMQVEMTYQGDPLLASYLIRDAQSLLDSQVDDQVSQSIRLHVR